MIHLRKGLWQLAAVLLAVMTVGCYSGSGRAPAGGLRVDNNGSVTMSQLFVTPSTSSTWGPDQLAPIPLQPGESITLAPLFPDLYDVQAVFADGSRDTLFDVEVPDGATTILSMLNTGTGTVAVFNNAPVSVTGVFLTPSTSNTWGPNQIVTPIAPGQTLPLVGVGPGTYDLRATFSDGSFFDVLSFPVAAGATTPVTVN